MIKIILFTFASDLLPLFISDLLAIIINFNFYILNFYILDTSMLRLTIPFSMAYKEADLNKFQRRSFEADMKTRVKRLLEIETRLFLAEQRANREQFDFTP